MTLEKLIKKREEDLKRAYSYGGNNIGEFLKDLSELKDNITQEDNYQRGYQKGREDMKKEIIEKQNKDRETYNEWTCVEAYDYEFDESLLSPTDK